MKKGARERAPALRLDRHLDRRGETLRKCKSSSRWCRDLGGYYAIDIAAGAIGARHIDLERMARAEGVLKNREVLA